MVWVYFVLPLIWNENNIFEAICLPPPHPLAVRYLLLWLHIPFSVIWKSALFSAAEPSSSIIPSPHPSPAVSHVSSYTQKGIRKEKLQSSSHTLYGLARCFGSFAGFNPQTTKKCYYSILWRGHMSLSIIPQLTTVSLYVNGRNEVQIQSSSLWDPQNPWLHSSSSTLTREGSRPTLHLAGRPLEGFLLPGWREGSIWLQEGGANWHDLLFTQRCIPWKREMS